MTEAPHEHEAAADVVAVAEAPAVHTAPAREGVADMPPASHNGVDVSAAAPATDAPAEVPLRLEVSTAYARVLSRPCLGAAHSRNADRAGGAAAASERSSKSRVIPFEGTVVHLCPRTRVLQCGSRACAGEIAASVHAATPPASEKTPQPKASAARGTLAPENAAASPATKTAKKLHRTHNHSHHTLAARPADAAVNGGKNGSAQKASRRRRNTEKPAKANGGNSLSPESPSRDAVKGSKLKILKISSEHREKGCRPHGIDTTPTPDLVLKKKKTKVLIETAEAATPNVKDMEAAKTHVDPVSMGANQEELADYPKSNGAGLGTSE